MGAPDDPGSGAERNRLGELFSDAVAETPSATFDAADVTAASARLTVRRRRTVAGASTLGVVILAVGVVTSLGFFGHTGGENQNVAGEQATSSRVPSVPTMRPFDAAPAEPPSGPMVGQGPGATSTQLPERSSKQGDETAGNPGPRAGAPRPGCVKADRELATALAGELPAAADAPVRRVQVACPSGARGAAFTVRDGSRSGTVSVVVSREKLAVATPREARGVTLSKPVRVRGGLDLVVVSKAGPSSPDGPLKSRVDEIARGTAGKL